MQTRVAKSKTATRNRQMMNTYTQQYDDDLSRANQSIASFQNGRESTVYECNSYHKEPKTEVVESEKLNKKIKKENKKSEEEIN